MSVPNFMDPSISHTQKDDARQVFYFFKDIHLLDEVTAHALQKALKIKEGSDHIPVQTDLTPEPSLEQLANAYHVFNHFIIEGFEHFYKRVSTRNQISRLLKLKLDTYSNILMDGKVYGFNVTGSPLNSDSGFELYVRRANKFFRFSNLEPSIRNVESIDEAVSRFNNEGIEKLVYTGLFPNPGAGIISFLNVYGRDPSSGRTYSPLTEHQQKALEEKGIKTITLPRLI